MLRLNGDECGAMDAGRTAHAMLCLRGLHHCQSLLLDVKRFTLGSNAIRSLIQIARERSDLGRSTRLEISCTHLEINHTDAMEDLNVLLHDLAVVPRPGVVFPEREEGPLHPRSTDPLSLVQQRRH